MLEHFSCHEREFEGPDEGFWWRKFQRKLSSFSGGSKAIHKSEILRGLEEFSGEIH